MEVGAHKCGIGVLCGPPAPCNPVHIVRPLWGARFMIFDAINGLASRIAEALGLNVNGLLLGSFFALFMWWSSTKDKQAAAQKQQLAEQQQAARAAAGPATESAEDGKAAEGDVDEVRRRTKPIQRMRRVHACMYH